MNSGLPSLRANRRSTSSASGRAAEDVLEQVGELLARQARELDAPRARVALELGEQGPQRVAAVQLVGAVGGDDEHALGPQAAREEDEEGPRRAIRPVDVLEHERERLLAAQVVEQRQQRLEQARLALGRLAGERRLRAELGEEGGELGADGGGEFVEDGVAVAGERPQDAHDRRVGQLLLAELDGLADHDARAGVARPARELGHHPRLADAGLTRDEGQGRVPGGGVAERRLELRELCDAPDQAAARHTCRHGLSIHGRRPRRRGRRGGQGTTP